LVHFGQFNGQNVPGMIWLVIKVGRDITPLSIVINFHEDLIKTI